MKVDIFNTDKKYNIIYADPPWQYKVWSKKTGLGRSAETRDRIVQLFGDIPRIELFARQEADGWDCWGNEV